jgi:hypothetical protein
VQCCTRSNTGVMRLPVCWHIAGLVLSSAHNESLKESVLVTCSDDFKSEIPAIGGAQLRDLVAHCGHLSTAYIM